MPINEYRIMWNGMLNTKLLNLLKGGNLSYSSKPLSRVLKLQTYKLFLIIVFNKLLAQTPKAHKIRALTQFSNLLVKSCVLCY